MLKKFAWLGQAISQDIYFYLCVSNMQMKSVILIFLNSKDPWSKFFTNLGYCRQNIKFDHGFSKCEGAGVAQITLTTKTFDKM